MTYADDVQTLLGLADSPDPRIRAAVAAGVAELPPDPEVDAALERLLNDDGDTFVLERALVACARTGIRGWRLICANPPAGADAEHQEEHRLAALQYGLRPEWLVRQQGRAALVELASSDPDPGVREEAAALLEWGLLA
ncbi:hypothetical protein [Parenemella sanctibonifatiensis]|uniref:HEAT repeat domain-containing protein n=1 Tax=Parenemella sanctibonifatiensis TaxID=2016505 RepID=A0A255EF98_9ACTN|nr:hypothetical protein [Parenemella sanctibonifatiensis]OYN90216.1 hypothetical protein CGZ91_08590 [Parenemella sanctibonifatiensis]